ncbi:MAG: hypothetical protein ACXVA2_18385 [Mucilaginibacter sp.]
MKQNFLKLSLFIFCVFIIFSGCKKNSSPTLHAQAKIIEHVSWCMACGTYFIKFNSDTTTLYRIANDLTPFGITSTSKFPIPVVVNWYWKPDSTANTGKTVVITGIAIAR